VVISGPAFSKTLRWPPGLTVRAVGTPEPSNPNLGTIVLSFPGLPAGPITAAGTVQCGGPGGATANVGGPLVKGQLSITNFNLDQMGGACQASVTLDYNPAPGQPDPYGVPSKNLSARFTIGSQPSYGFSAAFTQQCLIFCSQEQVVVIPGQPTPAGDDWSVTVTGPAQGHDPCQAYWPGPPPQSSPTFPAQGAVISLPTFCKLDDPSQLAVTVTYRFLGQVQQVTATSPQSGPGTTTTTTSTTSTTVPATTTTTGPPGAAPSATPRTALAAALRVAPVRAAGPGDAQVRAALEWTLTAAVVAWCSGAILRALRRKRSRKEPT
jgi:hypothetical protein